ncbi:MAG: HAD-IA family hydrolase [Verrucomicrobiaceae bacterium]
MELEVVFFDAAGTLIRPAEPVGLTYARFAGRHGIQARPEDVMQAFRQVWKTTSPPLHPPGRPPEDDDRGWWNVLVDEVFASVLGRPLPRQTLADLFADLYQHYAQPEAWSVFDDVLPALEDLGRDHRLLVLSNFDRRLRSILQGHGLLRLFEAIIISSEVGAAKPHPRMFQAALTATSAQPEQCLHVGDDIRCDKEGAEDAGMRFFAVHRPESGLDALVQKVRAGAYSGLRSPRT